MDGIALELNSFTRKLLVMEPLAGARLDNCKREAALLALFYRCDVEFTHNGIEYVAGHEVLTATVKELK